MKFQIKTKERDECREALDEFCDKLGKEYEKQLEGIPKITKGVAPIVMTATYEERKNGFILIVPLTMPSLMGVTFLIKRKMIKMLEGYFKEKKIKVSVKYIGN